MGGQADTIYQADRFWLLRGKYRVSAEDRARRWNSIFLSERTGLGNNHEASRSGKV